MLLEEEAEQRGKKGPGLVCDGVGLGRPWELGQI